MNFSIKQAFVFGWNTTRKYFFQVLVVLGITLGINLLLRFISGKIVNPDISFGLHVSVFIVAILAVIVIELFIKIGVIKESLVAVRGGNPDVKKVFSYGKIFFKVIGGWIVYGLFIGTVFLLSFTPFAVLGLVLNIPELIIFGFIISIFVTVYAMTVFGFARLVMVDQAFGPLRALRLSKEITKGNRAKILLFFVLTCLFNLVGILAVFLGLIVTIPVSFFALIWVYDQLLTKPLTAEQK